jgi:hypothetical protein
MPKQPYQRDPDGMRLQFHGMNIMLPPDKMPAGKFPYAQNVRAYLRDRIIGRAVQDSSVENFPSAVHSIRRLNDSTPAGPATGFILVAGAGKALYANMAQVDSGLSGNPISLIPFRPNASVQPWMYVGDSILMDKVRSDGTRYKMGIAEPQAAPIIAATPASTVLSLLGPVTVTYWGDSPHSGPVGEYIWKHRGDTSGSGPVRLNTPATGVTTGSSLIFDRAPTGNQQNPMEWVQYLTSTGTVNTAGTAVNWASGDQFSNISPGQSIGINGVQYVILAVPSNILITLAVSAGVQTGVTYQASALGGTVPVFQPALESEGYSDFNFCLEATLYVPAAGTYVFNINSKDEFMWGIGSGQGTVSFVKPAGYFLSENGQTVTAKNGYPLFPKKAVNDGQGQTDTAVVSVTFSAGGNYPLEIDYDYWYHSGRTLAVKVNGIDVPPVPGSTITQAQYRYVYRSSATGAVSNPSPPSTASGQSALANKIMASPSPDPQVDKIDFYRLDAGLTSYTYVGTGPNSNATFTDALLDDDIAGNPVLEFDNFEPFPSIDLPRSGVVNVSGGMATWVSGDQFNVRWLPGTIIIVGPYSGPGTIGAVAYTLDKRPTSATTLTATNSVISGGVEIQVPIADGTNLTYNIAEPILAAQPLPYMWGPTDNVNFAYGCGDPLRPGTLYWCKGNNLDSAPDTNQEDVTSPSEPLQNGCIVGGLGWVASSERAWLIYPNFFNALATVDGTVGSTWTLQESSLKRGLYIPRCLAVDGGDNVFFRAKDGIYISPGGMGGKSITDDDLFNLFPHEGFVPKPVVRAGFAIYPPDDTKSQLQKMNVANGYLYYDYIGVNGLPQTLVYDIQAGGWVMDVYQYPASVHVLEEGPNANDVIVGCQDGSVRRMVTSDSGAETATSVLMLPSFNAGDTRAQKHFGDLFIEGTKLDTNN